MKVNSDAIIKKDFILLDWNVIQYLKNPRNSSDEDVRQVIDSLYKHYEFPFCEAHLRDLERNHDKHPDYVETDLRFLQLLTHNVALGIASESDKSAEFLLTKYDPKKLFDEIISEPSQAPNITPDMGPQSSFYADMQAMDPNNPLYSMLIENGGNYNPEAMSKWLNNIYEPFFSEIEPYKLFRNYLVNLKRDIANSDSVGLNAYDLVYKKILVQRMTPFIDSLEINNENDLSAIWKDAITEFLRITHPTEIPFGLLISSAYSMLDFHPLFRERLKKNKNTLSNITRDSKIIFYASSSKYFVTEDASCLEKANFIFKTFACRTKALDMTQFLHKFS